MRVFVLVMRRIPEPGVFCGGMTIVSKTFLRLGVFTLGYFTLGCFTLEAAMPDFATRWRVRARMNS
jgi:hypothetical protein